MMLRATEKSWAATHIGRDWLVATLLDRGTCIFWSLLCIRANQIPLPFKFDFEIWPSLLWISLVMAMCKSTVMMTCFLAWLSPKMLTTHTSISMSSLVGSGRSGRREASARRGFTFKEVDSCFAKSTGSGARSSLSMIRP